MPAKGTDIFAGTELAEDGTEVVEQGNTEKVVETPEVQAPEREATHEELRADAATDGESDAVIEQLSEKESVTVADLRRIPGTEGMSDAELTTMWARHQKAAQLEAKGETGEPAPVAAPAAPPKPRGYKIYDDKDQEVVDLSKLTAEQFLAMKFGYNAMDKEHKKNFEELVRNASLGHFNEQKQAQLVAERNKVFEQLKQLQPEHQRFTQERQQLAKALEAYARGDDKPIKKIVQDYVAAISAQPQAAVENPQETIELEREGMKFYYETLVPTAYGVATEYGANPQEVLNAIKFYLEQEPEEFRTREKYDAIIKYELPALLEQNGYARKGKEAPVAAPDPRDTKIAELEKKLNGVITQTERSNTAKFGQKAKTAPGAGGGISAPAGDTMPAFKTREEMKNWLRSK